MSKPYDVVNEIQSTLSVAFVHGTDASLTLTSVAGFPTGGGYIRVGAYEADHWVLLEYTGIATNDLTGLTPCTLGVVETEAAWTFPIGTVVEVTNAAEMVKDVRDESPAKTILTTKGDIYAASAASTPARLGVGADGESLVADSGETTGLGWASRATIETVTRTIYADADAADDTGDGSVGDPFQLYATALADVKDVIADGVTITIHLDAAAAAYTAASTGRVCIGTGNLVIEGELSQEETATADSGTATTLTDSGAFTGDSYAGYLLYISSGTGAGQYRLIWSHTDDVLTTVGRFATSPAADSVYVIYGWGSIVTGTWGIVQGVISVNDLQWTGGIGPNGSATIGITRCHFLAGGAITAILPGGPCKINLDTCHIDNNGYGGKGVIIDSQAGVKFTCVYSWIHGSVGVAGICLAIWAPAVVSQLWGSVFDGSAGSYSVINIRNGGNVVFWTPTTNGAKNVVTIIGDAGNNYGVYAEKGGQATFLSATYVTFDPATDGGWGTARAGANATSFGYVDGP